MYMAIEFIDDSLERERERIAATMSNVDIIHNYIVIYVTFI